MKARRRTLGSRIGYALLLVAAVLLGQAGPSSAGLVPTPAPTAAAPWWLSPNGTFVKSPQDPRVFVVANGSLVYVDSFAPFGGPPADIMLIDDLFIKTAKAVPDGTFLATAGEGRVYRIVGGAPVYIDSWAPFGGQQPFAWVSPRAIREAGTGNWWNLSSAPKDGSQIMTIGDGRVYRFAGGSPIYLDNLERIDNGAATITVTPGAASMAGSGLWSNLRRVPADGTVVWLPYGGDHVFVGGAMIRSDSPDSYGEAMLSGTLFTQIGTGPWSHLRRVPPTGSLIATRGDGRVYQIIGGAPVYVDAWAAVGGPRPVVWVAPEVVDFSGEKWSWALSKVPADGTFVATYGEGRVHQFIGGAPVWVDSWASVGGVKPYTWVSRQAIANAGSRSWANLRRSPHDAFIATTGNSRVYQMVNGAPIYLASWNDVGGMKPFSWVSPDVVSRAGSGLYSNLTRIPPNGTDVSYGGAYRFADGGPVPTSNPWDGPTPDTIQLATSPSLYGSGPWSHLSPGPRDGSFVASASGRVYRMAGGSPIHVESWAPFGGPKPYTLMPDYVFDQSRPPVDGTFVSTTDGRVYVYAGGAPFYVTDWASFGGPKPYTVVSSGAIDSAGTGTWSRLPKIPPYPIFLKEAGGDNYYQLIGGAPVWLEPGWKPPAVNGTHDPDFRPLAQQVSAAVLTSSDPRWANIRRAPVDGTLLRNGRQYYQVVDSRLRLLPPNPPSPAPPLYDISKSTWVSAAFIAGVGTGRWSAILPPQ